MKSLRSFRVFLVAAAVAVIGSAYAAFNKVADVVTSCVYRVKAWAFEAFTVKADAVETAAATLPLVQRVRHAAFQLRLIKREHPIVTPDWRMCPST